MSRKYENKGIPFNMADLFLHVGYDEEVDGPVAAVEEDEEGGEDVGGPPVQVHLETMKRRLHPNVAALQEVDFIRNGFCLCLGGLLKGQSSENNIYP